MADISFSDRTLTSLHQEAEPAKGAHPRAKFGERAKREFCNYYGAALVFGVWRSNGASSSRAMAASTATPATAATMYAGNAGKWLIAIASRPKTAPRAYKTRTALRWLFRRFERRCAVWSLPGVVNGMKPRREREMEISVVSKIVAPRMNTGTSHATLGPPAITGRSFKASVAIRKPRNIAPPSPMKIFAGLKFQRRNPAAAPRTAAAMVLIRSCPLSKANIAKKR